MNYGGGYYAYIFAKMHAAKIWEKHFAHDPLSRKGGDYLTLPNVMLRYNTLLPIPPYVTLTLTQINAKQLLG